MAYGLALLELVAAEGLAAVPMKATVVRGSAFFEGKTPTMF